MEVYMLYRGYIQYIYLYLLTYLCNLARF